MGDWHSGFLKPMDTVLEQPVGVEAQPEVNEERVATFTDAQQALFNKAFRKREAALWRKYIEPMRRDLLDTLGLLEQVYVRAIDRLSVEDAQAIETGIAEIKKQYQGDTWQKR